MQGSPFSPPPFSWDEWYERSGGRKAGTPEAEQILENIREHQYTQLEDRINRNVYGFESPETASSFIKIKAGELGADAAGIARLAPEDIYCNRTVEGSNAIVVLQRMKRECFSSVPSTESALECLRVYQTLGRIVIRLASIIRDLGYPCTIGHPMGDSDVLHIPLAIKAGLGEPGRHGSLIRPGEGSLFRLGCVLTDLPLAIDRPRETGQSRICDRCKICRRYCPAGTIPDHRSLEAGNDPFGQPRYIVDTGRCFPYFAGNHYCSVCLAVCPEGRRI